MSERPGFERLAAEVISTGKCAGCGACFVVCPFEGVLDYDGVKPSLTGECERCGICLRACPRLTPKLDDLEVYVLGRTRGDGEEFGIYSQICVARSTDEAVRKRGQDGGVVTTLLTSALKSGMIDSAVVSGVDPGHPWLPRPKVATTVEEVMASAGTRYAYSSSITALKEGVARGYKRMAFVGTPCQIQAFRRVEKVPLKKYANSVAFTVGLFCTESFSYHGLMKDRLNKGLGIPLENIAKLNVKGRLLVHTKDGGVREIPLKEIMGYVRSGCHHCGDFSSELADISVGGIGLEGWTLTILRTESGEAAFKAAAAMGVLEVKSAEEFKRSLEMLVKLSKSKRTRLQA